MASDVLKSYIRPMSSPGASIGRATLLIVLSAVCFGSISVLTVLTTGAGVSLLAAMAWRYVIAAALLALAPQVREIRRAQRVQIIQLLVIGGCGQALITYLSLHALQYIRVGPLAFLFYTYPAWVAIVAAIRRTEPLSLVRIAALMLALSGVTIMVGAPTDRLNPTGVTLALASALLYSAYLPALERVQRGIPAAASTFVLVVGAAIAFVVAAIVSNELIVPTGREVWTNILLLAFASTVIAFSFLIAGLAILGPVRTAIIATVEPFFTALLGVVVLGNTFQASTIAGGVLIAAAVLTIEWSSGKGEISSRFRDVGDARSR